MYAHCHLCRKEFGANTAIPTMPVGRRLAYDVDLGRLWIVCPGCGEWNLTPMEERWEAIADCERLFASAPARASSANVGVSRAAGVDLIRIGPALRDELANWRYGPRFHRRWRRARILGVVAGATFVIGVTAAALLGMLSAGPAMALWGAAIVTVYLSAAGNMLKRKVGPERDVRLVNTSGRTIRIASTTLGSVMLGRERHRKARVAVHVTVPAPGGDVAFRQTDALLALGAVLPRLNWNGGSPLVIKRATEMLDDAEARIRDRPDSTRSAATAWELLAITNWPHDDSVAHMDAISRLALEMAVSEELERQAMIGEASVLGTRWLEAETVAAIADDMFLPESIREWIRLRRAEMEA